MTSIDVPENKNGGKYTIKYQQYDPDSKVGKATEMQVDYIIGSDGANSRVAKVRHSELLWDWGTYVSVMRRCTLHLPWNFVSGPSPGVIRR